MTTAERFDALWIPEPNTGCWLWLGGTTKRGYGTFWDHRTKKAHRFAYERHVGKVPRGRFLLHGCDTPSCVNPDHLTPGTHRQNMKDMRRKGRAHRACGDRHPQAKLDRDAIHEIRQLRGCVSRESLAERFQISPSYVSAIQLRRKWA